LGGAKKSRRMGGGKSNCSGFREQTTLNEEGGTSFESFKKKGGGALKMSEKKCFVKNSLANGETKKKAKTF